MDHFNYQNGVYHAEQVSLERIAAEIGTPFYCYSTATLERHYKIFSNLFPKDTLVAYAVKANGNPAVVATLARLGAGADVVSEGEIRLALAGGVPPERIVFSGVGKMRGEMAFALEKNIFQFNVESVPELEALNEVALAQGTRARIAIRVNPDVDPETHAKISTGGKETKFGIAMEDALPLYRKAADMAGIEVQGVSIHIGSQLTSLGPFREAFRRMREFVEVLRAAEIPVHTLDLGGGLGVPYAAGQDIPTPEEYAAAVHDLFTGCEGRLVLEPGRLLVGNAGLLVARVIYVKTERGRHFVILDAGMNDLMRPALYGAHHALVPVREPPAGTPEVRADIVGPVCETSDIFAEQYALPQPQPGDVMAFRTAGAYGASMANSYNARRLIPEVLVKGNEFSVIRARGEYETMLAATRMPDWR